MSYAGPVSGNRTSNRGRAASRQGAPRPIGSAESAPTPGHGPLPDDELPNETDWQQIAIFGAGLALGLALGAGAALLAAPQTGEETRAALRSRARRIKRSTTRRSRDAWSELGDELRGAAQSLRRRRAKRRLQAELDREAGE